MDDRPTALIVKDDVSAREALGSLLQEKGYRVRCFGSAEALLSEMPSGDCVVASSVLPGIDGLTLHRKLRESQCDIPLVLTTFSADVSMAVSAMKTGVADYIQKPATIEAIAEAIEDAVRSQRATSGPRNASCDVLSDRELNVLDLLVTGLSSKEIALKLGISYRTVEAHRLRIKNKLKARSTADLVRLALAAA
jgi:two-component system response regulator FixJ